MTPIGSIPSAPPFRLDRHEIAQALCQIRFSPILRIRQDDSIVEFQEELRDQYPQYARQKTAALVFTPAGVQQQIAQDDQHRFADTTGTYAVVLAPDFFALETSAYVNVEDFAGRVAHIAGAVSEQFGPAQITRFGLRFINELRLGSTDPRSRMREAISPTLLGAAGSDELRESLHEIQQAIDLRDGSDRVTIRHGFQPVGGTTVMPAPGALMRPDLQEPYYLLDIDAFSEQALQYSGDGIVSRLRTYNDWIRSVFAWAVREQYRYARLGQREVAP